MKAYIKMEKNIYKTWWNWNRKKKSLQCKRSILIIKNLDINKIVVSNKVSSGKKSFKYFISYEDAKRIALYVYFTKKWVHIEETWIKLNIYLF